MSRPVSKPALVLAAALTSALVAPRAAAQPSAPASAAALAQRERGIALLRAGQAAAAVDAFDRSLALVESPNTRLDLGRAYLALGRLGAALHQLDRARDTARARIDASERQYVLTAEAAASEADALRPRVPTIELRFSAPPPPGAVVSIAEARLPAAALGGPIPVDPGRLHVTLEGGGLVEQRAERSVREGEHAMLALRVLPGSAGGTDGRAAGPSVLRVLGWSAAVAGTVAAGTGLALWLGADERYRALRAPGGCALDCAAGIDQGRTLEVAGIGLMLGGATLAAAGAVVLLVGGPRRDRIAVTPVLSLHGGGVDLRF